MTHGLNDVFLCFHLKAMVMVPWEKRTQPTQTLKLLYGSFEGVMPWSMVFRVLRGLLRPH